MRAAVAALLVAGVLGTFLAAGGTRGEPVKPIKENGPKLWSAISIKPPVFDPEMFTIDRPKVRIYLGLVNDGTRTLETGLRESVLVVNGQPRRGEAWEAALKEGLRGDTPEKLSPGEHAGVVCPLDEVITERGTYRVSWKGRNFQSPEVVYRIMPRGSSSKPKPAAPQAANKPDSPKETQGKLWAVISIIPPLLIRENTSTVDRTMIFLELVNDGAQTIETGAGESVLVVNGKPLRSGAWDSALHNGLISFDRWEKLPPGDFTGIGRSLHGIITEPGTYRVSWRGKNFQSPEVVYRILPGKAK
jgi:hypothetical protein